MYTYCKPILKISFMSALNVHASGVSSLEVICEVLLEGHSSFCILKSISMCFLISLVFFYQGGIGIDFVNTLEIRCMATRWWSYQAPYDITVFIGVPFCSSMTGVSWPSSPCRFTSSLWSVFVYSLINDTLNEAPSWFVTRVLGWNTPELDH